MVGMHKATSIHQLQAANTKEHIEKKHDEDTNVHMVIPWEHMHNALHVDDLDDRL